MAEEVYLTAEGKRELEERLKYLKTSRRTEISEKIKVARDFGDLSENAEYDAAKAEQSQVEGEILEIESKIKNAKIINEDSVNRRNEVKLGSTVTLETSDGKRKVYKIVGTTEADPFSSPTRISNESPIGRGVLGKRKEDSFIVTLPQGKTVKYKIVDLVK